MTAAVAQPPEGAARLPWLTLPGLANTHSHAFHRVLRGRAQEVQGTFWTWRRLMCAVAATLDPDSYPAPGRGDVRGDGAGRLHRGGGVPLPAPRSGDVRYTDPNEMGLSLVQAAGEAGVRLTLIDTCYLSGGFGAPLEATQRRSADASADAWAGRARWARGSPRCTAPT